MMYIIYMYMGLKLKLISSEISEMSEMSLRPSRLVRAIAS